jgi:hypothetical protein
LAKKFTLAQKLVAGFFFLILIIGAINIKVAMGQAQKPSQDPIKLAKHRKKIEANRKAQQAKAIAERNRILALLTVGKIDDISTPNCKRARIEVVLSKEASLEDCRLAVQAHAENLTRAKKYSAFQVVGITRKGNTKGAGTRFVANFGAKSGGDCSRTPHVLEFSSFPHYY